MHLLCRADADTATGVGHALRVLAVAEAAQARGWRVTISGDLVVQFVREQAQLLGVGMVAGFTDAVGMQAAVTDLALDVVLADSYQLPDGLHAAARDVGAALVSFEDSTFGRRAADVVIDYQLGADRLSRPDDGSAVVLRGPKYAPIRCAVTAARDSRPTRPFGQPPRVLVVMGGTDPTATTPLVLEVLSRLGSRLDVTVVRGSSELPSLMADSDLVVTAAGITVFEACCIGVPTAAVAAVPNQVPGYRALVDAQVVLGLGTPQQLQDEPDRAAATLSRWVDDVSVHREMAARGARLVDGRGCARVLDAASEVAG